MTYVTIHPIKELPEGLIPAEGYISDGVYRKIKKRVYNGFLGIREIVIFYKEGRLYLRVVTIFEQYHYECNITEL
jgi:hypothetical protein